MASISARNDQKECFDCRRWIAAFEFPYHVAKCTGRPEEEAEPPMKVCGSCDRKVKNLEEHHRTCSEFNHDRSSSPRGSASPRSSIRRNNPRVTKSCPLCGEMFDENEFLNHTDRCGNEKSRNSVSQRKPSTAERDYYDPKETSRSQSTKICGLCFKNIPEREYVDHLNHCGSDDGSKRHPTKRCPHCSKEISERDYYDHIDRCDRQSSKDQSRARTKQCPLCSEYISEDQYQDHFGRCSDDRDQRQANDRQDRSNGFKNRSTLHSSHASVRSSMARRPKKTCFQCSNEVSARSDSAHTMPCRYKHMFCLRCIQTKAQEHIEANSAPVCSSGLCEHPLTRYDVACLPIDPNLMQRLSACVQTPERPQCPMCSYYVDFKTMGDFQAHVNNCDAAEKVPCEYCHCPFAMGRLDDHERTCRKLLWRERIGGLVDFILPRAKYPIEAGQLRFFIERQRNQRSNVDPHSIINALAEFNGAFPFDIPKKQCVVCIEDFVYDDIFVFGCQENHKICYSCFAESCQAKINNNELLTCAECNYLLPEGEIKELRLPEEEKQRYLEYQTQKTFDRYAGNTQSVVRCPNRGCKWVAELENPNEKFQVTCKQCQYQFCSLCGGQYHFRSTCQEIPEITQQWFFWCQTGRENYWRAKAEQDQNFNAQLAEFERQRQATAQRNDELRQRYNELVADENFKAQNCRSCPHCGRVVQKLEGCDLMVCGRNYHGGDQQSGCGQAFRWSQAQPYVPINTGPAEVQFNMIAPTRDENVVHQGIRCDGCQQDVQGIRFDCVYCASLIFCEQCEQRRTLEHYEENQNNGQRQHVFRLTQRPPVSTD